MRMKKWLWIVATFYILLLVSGCEKKQEIQNTESEVFFYKEYYQPEKSHREEEIFLEEACKQIVIQGTTTSGTIRVVFENKDEESLKYEYLVEGTLSEVIEIKKENIADQWVLITDINEETEGTIRLLFQ